MLLARHGETDFNASLRFQGRLDPPLNETGRAQAQALAEALAGAGDDLIGGGAVRAGHDGIRSAIPAVREIWASPYERARESAQLIAAELGLQVRYDARLKESDVGEWSGFSYAEIQASDPGGFQAWVDGDLNHRFPGGESLAEVSARVLDAVADARRLAPTALLVCHGGVIRAALAASGFHVREPGVAANGEAVAL